MSEQRFAWQVPVDHPAFAGHFPGRPILPGVVLLDRVVWLADTWVGAAAGWSVAQAKFLSPVGPGEALVFFLTPDSRGGWRFAVQAAEGRDVAAGNLAQPKA